MTRTMYDGISVPNLPSGAPLYAGYLNGHWPTVPALRARFPEARIVEITVFASEGAGHVLDVEPGDASAPQAVDWVRRRRAAGADPTVYCNASTWPAVRAAFRSAGVPQPHYWVADYDNDPAIPAGAIAKQFRNTSGYDVSAVADYWPGVDPEPQEDQMTLTAYEINEIADAVYKKLMDADGDLPAPSDAADYPTNKFWTFKSWVLATGEAARTARANTEAIKKKLGIS